LWLRREAVLAGEQATLAWMIRTGPDGVLPLAMRHADPRFLPRLERIARERDAAHSVD
jgi:hypothetical protein